MSISWGIVEAAFGVILVLIGFPAVRGVCVEYGFFDRLEIDMEDLRRYLHTDFILDLRYTPACYRPCLRM
jgi:hypothetical protein